MQDGHFVVNFHEHPGAQAIENSTRMGIDMAVLLSVGTDALTEAVRMAREQPDVFVPFYWVSNTQDLEDEPRRLRQAVQTWGIRGVKFQPRRQHWLADDLRIYPIYEVCTELGLVCTWHTGMVALHAKPEPGVRLLDSYTDPTPMDQVALDFPELRLCIAHMGGNYRYEALILAEKHENVYLDTAFLPFFCRRMLPAVTPEMLIAHAAHVVGAEKILYGSEGLWPQAVLAADLTEEEKGLILGGNSLRLLDLTPATTG